MPSPTAGCQETLSPRKGISQKQPLFDPTLLPHPYISRCEVMNRREHKKKLCGATVAPRYPANPVLAACALFWREPARAVQISFG